MKFFCIVSLLLFFFFLAKAQNKPVEVPMLVLVQDMKGKPRNSEQILFVSKKNKKEYKGISNEKGEFKIKLPAGAGYEIKIKGIGSNKDYSSFDIPLLPPGQEFKSESVITIQFEPSKQFTLDNVHFDSGKSTLRKESFKELDEMVEYMNARPGEKIEIAGHTDNIGSDESNLKLSQERAEAIRTFLVSKGIKAEKIAAKGYGASQPVADNSTEQGRQKNRRTEVRILEN